MPYDRGRMKLRDLSIQWVNISLLSVDYMFGDEEKVRNMTETFSDPKNLLVFQGEHVALEK